MADLKAGSLIGGENIAYQGMKNNHEHFSEDFFGYKPVALLDVGANGGIDAESLSGLSFDD